MENGSFLFFNIQLSVYFHLRLSLSYSRLWSPNSGFRINPMAWAQYSQKLVIYTSFFFFHSNFLFSYFSHLFNKYIESVYVLSTLNATATGRKKHSLSNCRNLIRALFKCPECCEKWSCLVVSDSIGFNLSGSSNHGIFQAKILELVAFSFSRGSSRPRD